MACADYRTIAAFAEDQFVEKRSRFIGAIAPVSTEEEALAFLEARRELHREATHNVYVYTLREGGLTRFSDDGEPSGTAGKPALDVLRGSGLVDVAIVVTRYFGGTLLGTGGLTRAYAQFYWDKWKRTSFVMDCEGHIRIVQAMMAGDVEGSVQELLNDISSFNGLLFK